MVGMLMLIKQPFVCLESDDVDTFQEKRKNGCWHFIKKFEAKQIFREYKEKNT